MAEDKDRKTIIFVASASLPPEEEDNGIRHVLRDFVVRANGTFTPPPENLDGKRDLRDG